MRRAFRSTPYSMIEGHFCSLWGYGSDPQLDAFLASSPLSRLAGFRRKSGSEQGRPPSIDVPVTGVRQAVWSDQLADATAFLSEHAAELRRGEASGLMWALFFGWSWADKVHVYDFPPSFLRLAGDLNVRLQVGSFEPRVGLRE